MQFRFIALYLVPRLEEITFSIPATPASNLSGIKEVNDTQQMASRNIKWSLALFSLLSSLSSWHHLPVLWFFFLLNILDSVEHETIIPIGVKGHAQQCIDHMVKKSILNSKDATVIDCFENRNCFLFFFILIEWDCIELCNVFRSCVLRC